MVLNMGLLFYHISADIVWLMVLFVEKAICQLTEKHPDKTTASWPCVL